MNNGMWQNRLQHGDLPKRMFSDLRVGLQNPDKINPLLIAKPAAPISIKTIETKALNGDYAGVIQDLVTLGINYVKTVNSNNFSITFNYQGKEYEYVFFGNAMKNPTLGTEEPSETQPADEPQDDGVDSNDSTTGDSTDAAKDQEYSLENWMNRPCGGTLFPAEVIEEVFSADEIAMCFVKKESGYVIKDCSSELNLRTSMNNMSLSDIREILDNINNNEPEKNNYNGVQSYTLEEIQRYKFSEQEIAEYFVKNDKGSYCVKQPLIIGGKQINRSSDGWDPAYIHVLVEILRDYKCSSGEEVFDNIFDYYYFYREKPDENANTTRIVGAIKNPESYFDESIQSAFGLGAYSYKPGVREYIKSILGDDYNEQTYKYIINTAYNSLDISDYSVYDQDKQELTVNESKFKRDLLAAIDKATQDYKTNIERRKGDDFDNIWDYYTREELGIDPEKDGEALCSGTQDPADNIRSYHRLWLKDADYTGYAASRWNMRDMIDTTSFKDAFGDAWERAFTSLDLTQYYTKTSGGDYIMLINKFKEDFINALDMEISNTKPQI